MDSLHAPWRIDYILAPKPPPGDLSLFAAIAASNDDHQNLVVARERNCFALLNSYPYTGGHLLIVPYRQCADFADLTHDELHGLMLLTQRCQKALRQIMNPQGFNIGLNLRQCAGAGITEHLHIHVVPRWNGDTNFMPVLSSTTVVPQALSTLADQLRTTLAQIA